MEKNLNEALGIRTQDRRMECTDESNELWRPPPSEKSNLYEQNVTVGQRVDQSLGT